MWRSSRLVVQDEGSPAPPAGQSLRPSEAPGGAGIARPDRRASIKPILPAPGRGGSALRPDDRRTRRTCPCSPRQGRFGPSCGRLRRPGAGVGNLPTMRGPVPVAEAVSRRCRPRHPARADLDRGSAQAAVHPMRRAGLYRRAGRAAADAGACRHLVGASARRGAVARLICRCMALESVPISPQFQVLQNRLMTLTRRLRQTDGPAKNR